MATNRVGLAIGLGVLGLVKVAGRCDGGGKNARESVDPPWVDVVRVDRGQAVAEAGDDE